MAAVLIYAGIGALVGAVYWYGSAYWSVAGEFVAALAGIATAAFLGWQLVPRKRWFLTSLGSLLGVVLALIALFRGGPPADIVRAAGYGALAGLWLDLLTKRPLQLNNPSDEGKNPLLSEPPFRLSWLGIGATAGVVASGTGAEVVSDFLHRLAAATICGVLAGGVLINLQFLFPFVRRKAGNLADSFTRRVIGGKGEGTELEGCARLLTRLAGWGVQFLLTLLGTRAGGVCAAAALIVGVVLDGLFGAITDRPAYWVIATAIAWATLADSLEPEEGPPPEEDESPSEPPKVVRNVEVLDPEPPR